MCCVLCIRTELGSQYYPVELNVCMSHVTGDLDGFVSCRVGDEYFNSYRFTQIGQEPHEE